LANGAELREVTYMYIYVRTYICVINCRSRLCLWRLEWTRGRAALSYLARGTLKDGASPLKPKDGLSGPPVQVYSLARNRHGYLIGPTSLPEAAH